MKRKLAALVGQSNEGGSGVVPDINTGDGAPLRDPVKPNGTTARSMWPELARLAGKRGVWLDVINTAVGATSIVVSWCGKIDNWASGKQTTKGQYVISAGRIWRSNLAAGVTIVSTVAPTGTADTTGADNIPWAHLGIPGVLDVPGTVCAPGHPRFDPNGYISAAFGALTAGQGYDEKWLFVSIGQGDRTLASSRYEFALAYKIVTDYALAQGFRVALGFTCYAATGADAWYQSDLLPGYFDALAGYQGDGRVVKGANLREALGVLAVTPASGPGLQSDLVHMNDPAYALASLAWANALEAAGVI